MKGLEQTDAGPKQDPQGGAASAVFQKILTQLSFDERDGVSDFVWRRGVAPETVSLEQLAGLIAAEEQIQMSLGVHSTGAIRAASQERCQRVKATHGVELVPAFLEQQYQAVVAPLSEKNQQTNFLFPAPVAHGTERRPPKPKDVGSNPTRRIFRGKLRY